MSLINFEGIIMKTTPYKENSKIVTVFTRNKGKISFIGNSSQKGHSQNAAILQVGNFVKGVYYKKQEMSTLGTLNQVVLVHQFQKTKMDFLKLALSQYAIEFSLKNLEDEEVNTPLFDLLKRALDDIETTKVGTSWRHMWDYHALKVLGFEPVFKYCATCGEEFTSGRWNPMDGGVSCLSHGTQGFLVHPSDLETLREISKRFHSEKECPLSPSVKEAFSRMINEYCGGPFKTLTFYGIS